MLLFGGALKVFTNPSKIQQVTVKIRAPWIWFVLLVIFAIGGPLLATAFSQPWLMLMNRFYRYGYTVIGGGQIVIPLMIQDLVNTNSLISLETFLSGYAIDQAIPGPLFSFAAFVGVQASPTASLSWLVGLGSGLSIFLPGIFLVYLIVPIWQQVRHFDWVKIFLKGIGVSVSAFIVLTAITQTMQLSVDWMTYALLGLTLALLVSKKVPAPLIVLLLSGVALLI
ncbi:MAG: chromate transporter [Bacilli bacterium]